MGFGPTQRRVLEALANDPDTLTVWELTIKLPRRGYRRVSDSSINSSLRGLLARGLVERVGVAHGGARTWAITPAGRAALAEGDS